MDEWLTILRSEFRWQDIVEIVILTYISYRFLVFMGATRAIQVLKGIGFLVTVAFVARLAELHIIAFLARSLLGIGVIGLLIVFQPELRRALAQVGHKPMFRLTMPEERVIEELVKAANLLASRHRGALVVIERDTRLEDLMETGVRVNSELSSEILDAIFIPQGPLHDGAVVIHDGRIAAAACIIAIAEGSTTARTMGTRHFAAVSLSRDTDAVVLVVSEEKGEISLAMGGELKRGLDRISLRNTLRNIFISGKKHWWSKKVVK